MEGANGPVLASILKTVVNEIYERDKFDCGRLAQYLRCMVHALLPRDDGLAMQFVSQAITAAEEAKQVCSLTPAHHNIAAHFAASTTNYLLIFFFARLGSNSMSSPSFISFLSFADFFLFSFLRFLFFFFLSFVSFLLSFLSFFFFISSFLLLFLLLFSILLIFWPLLTPVLLGQRPLPPRRSSLARHHGLQPRPRQVRRAGPHGDLPRLARQGCCSGTVRI